MGSARRQGQHSGKWLQNHTYSIKEWRLALFPARVIQIVLSVLIDSIINRMMRMELWEKSKIIEEVHGCYEGRHAVGVTKQDTDDKWKEKQMIRCGDI